MKEFAKKYLTQRNRNIISIIIIILGIGYLINYIFYSPSYINLYVATNVYKTPANSYFEDDNFYKCVIDAYNKENKTSLAYTTNLSDEQLASINKLEKCINIVSTKGLEILTNLNTLEIYSSPLTKIDVDNNQSLIRLDLHDNRLIKLDVSKNILLKSLDISSNKLDQLDVSKNTQLWHLEVNNNQLNELDVSNNPALNSLSVRENKLTELDISNNPALNSLSIDNNYLNTLDISNNNQLQYLNISNNKLTELDASNNPALFSLSIENNYLNTLDISNNTKLSNLDISNNQLIELDVSKNMDLTRLCAYDNQLTAIDLSKNTNLEDLMVYSNQLTTLDVSKNTLLDTLFAFDNKITELDISKNTSLKYFNVYKNLFSDEVYLYKDSVGIAVSKVKVADDSIFGNPVWKSDNENIATVSESGEITAVSVGDTSIIGIKEGKNSVSLPSHTIYSTTNNVHVIEITSSKYKIANNNIYILNDKDIDVIKNNLNIPENIDVDIDLNNKILRVKYKDSILKAFNLITIDSTKYKIVNNDIILYDDIDIKDIKNNITINSDKINLELNNNKLLIKYNEEILKEYDIVSYNSNKYDLSKDNIILIGESTIDLDSINTINCSKEVIDDKLIIKYNDEILKEFNISRGISFDNLKVINNNIVIGKDEIISYNDFTNNISTEEGYSYKLYNGNDEVTNGNISIGMVLKVYYNNEEIDSYNITNEYLEFDKELEVLEEDKIINNINVGTTIKNILNYIKTSGIIEVVDKNNNVINKDNNIIRTGDKFKINVYGSTLEYTSSVNGDGNSDGKVDVMDIMSIIDTIVEAKELDKVYYNALDYNNDQKINVMDIMGIIDYIVK